MGITLQRKDKTSIICSNPIKSKSNYFIKSRFTGAVIAFSLMAIGIWIMINIK